MQVYTEQNVDSPIGPPYNIHCNHQKNVEFSTLCDITPSVGMMNKRLLEKYIQTSIAGRVARAKNLTKEESDGTRIIYAATVPADD